MFRASRLVRCFGRRFATEAKDPGVKKPGATGILLTGVGAAAGAVALSWMFLQDAYIKFVLSLAEPKIKQATDVTMKYRNVRGSLSLLSMSVSLTFDGLHLSRPVIDSKKQSAFDMEIKELSLKASVGGLSSEKPSISEFKMKGVDGSFQRHPDSPPLPPVCFEQFAMNNANIAVSTIGGDLSKNLPVMINSMSAEKLKLDDLPVSLLARTKIDGALSGSPFALHPVQAVPQSNQSGRFYVRSLPLSVLKPLAPAGSPLSWVGGGNVDIDVRADWQQATANAPYALKFANKFLVGAVQAAVPDASSPTFKAVGTPVVTYLNQYSKDVSLPVTFDLALDQNQVTEISKRQPIQNLAKFFVKDFSEKLQEKAKQTASEKAAEFAALAKEQAAIAARKLKARVETEMNNPELKQKAEGIVSSVWSLFGSSTAATPTTPATPSPVAPPQAAKAPSPTGKDVEVD